MLSVLRKTSLITNIVRSISIIFLWSTHMTVFAAKPAPKPTPVMVTEAALSQLSDTIETLGTLKARESINVTSPVADIITDISFHDNQNVKQGDLLLQLDATEERAALKEQQSYIAEAQRQVNRLKPLVQRGAATAALLDENRRDLEGAKARAVAIQSRIDQRSIIAPFDGTVGLRNISIGALIQPGNSITTLDDTTIMKLDFSIPEIFLAALKPGIAIAATSDAYPTHSFAGEIANISSRVNTNTRSLQARAIFDNMDMRLKPGMLMQVKLNINPRTGILIPEEALIADGAQQFVFLAKKTAKNTTVEKQPVVIGTRLYGDVEILEGIHPGDLVVTQGIARIKPGAVVQIVTSIKES